MEFDRRSEIEKKTFAIKYSRRRKDFLKYFKKYSDILIVKDYWDSYKPGPDKAWKLYNKIYDHPTSSILKHVANRTEFDEWFYNVFNIPDSVKGGGLSVDPYGDLPWLHVESSSSNLKLACNRLIFDSDIGSSGFIFLLPDEDSYYMFMIEEDDVRYYSGDIGEILDLL